MRQLNITERITDRNSRSLESYLRDISHYDLIGIEEEVALAKKIRTGDKMALEKLVRANLRFVVSVAKQYQNQGLSLSDLINEGNVGLVKAAGRFDETRGFKFISYAVWWIRQCIIVAISENSRLIRLPLNKVDTMRKIRKAEAEWQQQNEREPTEEEIAAIAKVPVAHVHNTLGLGLRHISVDAPLRAEEDTTILDTMEDAGGEETDRKVSYTESLQKDIDEALKQLTPQEQEIICLFFGLRGVYPHTLEDIAFKSHISRERVRQIKSKAILRLQTTNFLKTYLGN